MMKLLAVMLAVVPVMARAEFVLSDMVGSWSGSGMYYEAMSQAKMKCRLTMAGDAAGITMKGRCGSSLGAHDVVLDFVAEDDGRVFVQGGDNAPSVDSEIEELTGKITGNQLNLSGQAGPDSVRMQFVLNEDGSIYFATERKWPQGDSRSKITLTRR